jgi:hypothetical protein
MKVQELTREYHAVTDDLMDFEELGPNTNSVLERLRS